jgi:hypothetical protein
MEERERFIRDWQLDLYTMTELSARYDVSRKTGYKWLGRFDEGGRQALGDRSRAPHQCPHRISEDTAHLICDARRQHPTWGPDKLLDWLEPRHPGHAWPAVSTAGDLLARKGLVKKRRRRRVYTHPGVVPATTTRPNDLWDRGLQGAVPDGGWDLLLSIDRGRSAHALPAGMWAWSIPTPASARCSIACSARIMPPRSHG